MDYFENVEICGIEVFNLFTFSKQISKKQISKKQILHLKKCLSKLQILT